MQPIELRLNKFTVNKQTFYTVDKVWPGICNISYGLHKFMTYRDAATWAKREWFGIPFIRSY